MLCCAQAARRPHPAGQGAARFPARTRHLLRGTGDAVGEEAVGPAGPTTANRMDRFSEVLLRETGYWRRTPRRRKFPLQFHIQDPDIRLVFG